MDNSVHHAHAVASVVTSAQDHPQHQQVIHLILNQTHPAVVAGDVAAYGITGAVIAGWLPTISTALSIVWFFIQMGMLLYRAIRKFKRRK